MKLAVISASALSLLYRAAGLPDSPKEKFLEDRTNEAERDIRECLDAGAANVQIDFTEARQSLKLDPSAGLLRALVGLNNKVLNRFTVKERKEVGVHTCPDGDHDATHSAEVDDTDLLPLLFELNAGRFYVQLASEADQKKVLATIRGLLQAAQIVFVGATDPINPLVETPEQVRDRVLEAAEFISAGDDGRLRVLAVCG